MTSITYAVNNITEIADLFDKAATDLKAREAVSTNKIDRQALRAQVFAWNQAALIIRNTTIKEPEGTTSETTR